MTWLELVQKILQMPPSEMTKQVKIFDYNDDINKDGDMVAAFDLEPYDLDSPFPDDFSIVFDSSDIYYG